MPKPRIISSRKLSDLASVGPATLKDFALLNITTVNELKQHDAHSLYIKLSLLTGVKQDPCVEDVFACAIAQAQNPMLPKEQCQWWYWSKIRKNKNKEEL